MYIIVLCLFHCILLYIYIYIYVCVFTILDYSSALEYSIIRRYTNIVYYYYNAFRNVVFKVKFMILDTCYLV